MGPYQINGGVTPDRLNAAKVMLWKGHCSVHQRFLPEHVDRVRAKYPGMQVIVHPECRWEVCQKADALGSTERIIEIIESAPEGSSFAVGTEIHLVNRLASGSRRWARRSLHWTRRAACARRCIASRRSTWPGRSKIWSRDRVVNRIQVDDDVKQWAQVALDRMLEIRD